VTTLVLVAHGTRDPAGHRTVQRIAAGLRPRAGVPVVVGYADVREPTVAEALAAAPGPAVVVPAFLATGYHVRADVPAQLAAAGRTDATMTAPLGPDPLVVAALADRAADAGWRPGDGLVLAAAGSRDPRAAADVRRAAALLSSRTGTPVPVGHVTSAPHVADAVAAARTRHRRVVIASYLLAPGRFHSQLATAGADAVAAPLGDHPAILAALLTRYATALTRAAWSVLTIRLAG
jgi:sirohydrochlorin ferrochelatase